MKRNDYVCDRCKDAMPNPKCALDVYFPDVHGLTAPPDKKHLCVACARAFENFMKDGPEVVE